MGDGGGNNEEVEKEQDHLLNMQQAHALEYIKDVNN